MVRGGRSSPLALQALKWLIAVLGLTAMLGSLGLLLLFNFPSGQTLSAFPLRSPMATPAPTFVPTFMLKPVVIVQVDKANVREGPGTAYRRLGQVTKNTRLEIVGKNPAGDWWQVCCVNGQQVWIIGRLVRVEGDISGVQVAASIPPPPLTPAPAASATCTLTAMPRPTLMFTPTHTPTSTPIRTLIPTLTPTATPMPTHTPAPPPSPTFQQPTRTPGYPLNVRTATPTPTPTAMPKIHRRLITIEWWQHMNVGDERRFKMTFAPETGRAILTKEMGEFTIGPGTAVAMTPQFSENIIITQPAKPLPRVWFEQYHVYAEAKLHTLAFEWTLVGPARREVLLDQAVTWEWLIKPREPGMKWIIFTIDLFFEPQEATIPLKSDIPTWWSETVQVDVRQPLGLTKQTANLVGSLGFVIGSGLSTPLWLVLYDWWRQRRRKWREEDPAWRLRSLQRRRQRIVKSLYHLEEQRSKHGIDVPLHILHQIDDCQAQLAQIDQELAVLKEELAKKPT